MSESRFDAGIVRKVLTEHGRILLALLVAALVVHDIFGQHGYMAMRHTQQEIAKVKQNLARLNEENRDLAEQVKSLRSDPLLIEKIARDELNLARPGEVIIRIPRAWTRRSAPQPSVPATR